MAGNFPQINLDPKATPWAKEAQKRILLLEQSFSRQGSASDNASRAQTSTMATLSKQIAVLAAVANVQYAEWTNQSGTAGTGWLGSPASVTISSPTGRLEVGFGGSLNSGNGVFCYQVVGASSGTIVGRDSVRANLAQRAALSGGASFTPSIFNTVIIAVPANETLTVSAQMYAEVAGTTFFGARILARVAP